MTELRVLGRQVTIEQLNQFTTYGGLLEGLPTREMNERLIRHALDDAKKLNDAYHVYLIPPVEKPLDYDGAYPFGTPASLPPICCTVVLHSSSPARDPAKDCSALTVVWFQEEYAFPIAPAVMRAFAALDWKALAYDGEY